MKDKNKKTLLENFFSLSILQGVNYILPLVTLPYLVRVLGPAKFGLIIFAQAFIKYFNTLTDYGFKLSATREISIYKDNKEKVSEIFSSVITIKFVLLVLSLIIMTVIVFSFERFRRDWIVYYLTFGTVVGQVLFPVWFFQGMERMKYITLLNITAKLIFTVSIFVFVREVSDYIYVPLINSLGFVIAGVLAIWIILRDFKLTIKIPSYKETKHQLKEGWYTFGSIIGTSLYRDSNILILGLLANNLIVGYYSIAEKTLGAIQALQDPAGQTLFPYLSQKFKNLKGKSIDFLLKYFKQVFLIYSTIFILTFCFSRTIIKIISGKAIENSIQDLKILSIVILIGGLNYYFGVLGLLALGFSRKFMRSVLIAGACNIVGALVLGFFLKDKGVSISLVMSETLLLVLLSNQIKRIKTFK